MTPANSGLCVLVLCASITGVASGQPSPTPDGQVTPERYVRIKLDSGAPLKLGAPIRGHTLEPLYVNDQLIFPANTSLDGEVALIVPAPRRRQIEAYTHADFTPLRRATLRFYRAIDASGNLIPLQTGEAQLITTTVRLQSSPAHRRSWIGRLWARGINEAKEFGRQFTEPGRLQRAREFAYSQLPYHPQSLLSGTEFDLPILQLPVPPRSGTTPAKAVKEELPAHAVQVHTRLVTPLDSRRVKKGDSVVTRVTRPVVSGAGHLIVPQGSLVRGAVLETKQARYFGRSGTLRFTFSEVVLPTGETHRIAGVPRAIYSEPGRPQVLDSEGGVEAQSARSTLLPLILGGLATRSVSSVDRPRRNATLSSNGFGIITRIVAYSSGSRIFGGVVGGVATARAVYTRFIGKGREVEFPANTPIEIELNPVDAPVLRGSTEP